MRKHALASVGLVLLCLVVALGTASGSPDTITVNSTTDVLDADSSCNLVDIGDLPGTDTKTSLREAICAANNNAGSDTIAFDIPISDAGYQVSGIAGTWTISLTTGALPTLTDGGTIISGTTQTDLNPDGPEIEISGAALSGAHCLIIESANNVVHGLVINQCPLAGVLIQKAGSDYNRVSGSYIGTDAAGSSGLGNKRGVGIGDGAQGNVVGGNSAEERNVISSNSQYGVYIYNDSDGNTVSGNYIGTDATGSEALSNTETGVAIAYGPQNNSVGGDAPGERNIISGNDGGGVSISGTDTTTNTVSGNFIGVVVSGTETLGNGGSGVGISAGAQNNTIGGDAEGERNVISGNWMGVNIGGTDTVSNTVSGNYIGTDVTGTLDRGNTNQGVRIASGAQNNIIGGQTAGERNIISGNNYDGVWIGGSETNGNTVSRNYIGIDAGGTQELGNTYDGVLVNDGAQNNVIGGLTAAARNVIAANGGSGVHIFGDNTDSNTVSQNYVGTDAKGIQDKGNSDYGVRVDGDAQDNTVGPHNLIAYNDSGGVRISGFSTLGNTITENSIHNNVSLGIELANGGNSLHPAPTVNPVDGCFANVSGTATPGDAVEVFTGPDDEGKRYLATDMADGAGDWEVLGPVRLDTYVTATATDAGGNTSEFSPEVESNCYLVFLPLGVKN
jgi:hypothetical protein